MKQNYFLRMFTILLFLCITTHSYAEVYSGSCGENVKWSLDTETGWLEITGSGEMNGYTHYSNTPWYNYKSYIKECNIKNGITTIGANAFYECYSLTNVTIPKSITTIGSQAFYNCTGLKNVYISDLAAWCNISFRGYTYGSSSANPLYYAQHLYLNGEEIKDLVIPNGVSTIKDYAFNGFKGLTSVTIPNSVTTIGNTAFYFCTGLTDITIPNSVTMIGNDAFHNTHWYNNQPDGIIYLGNHFYDYKGTMPQNTVINIKEGTTTIASCAFSSCTELSSITIPNSITTIGNYTFSGCTGLKSITLPNDLTIIGNCAFYNCTGLTEITIPNNVTTIGDDAFNGCNNLKTVINLSNLNITIGNTSNGYVAYYANKVINADAQIEDFLFIETEEGNTLCNYIGNKSILSLPLDYKGGKYGIGDNVFQNCTRLTSVTIPNSVTTINSGAFYGCTGLTSVTIPNSVTTINSGAFYGCTGLRSITIPNSVTTIGNGAFYGCTGLTSVHITDIAAWCNISFEDYYFSNPLYYAEHLYLNGKEIKNLVIPNDVTTIGNYAFYNCTGLTSITIPNSVTNIGSEAFYGCNNLTSVHITDIAAWCNITFDGASSNPVSYAKHLYLNGKEIKDLVIPDDVTTIRDYAFGYCTGLTSVTIPNSVTTIGGSAFEDCTGLTSVTIPNSVTNIGNKAFYGCNNLKTVYNLSDLNITKGSTSNGYVAYYADKVVNADTQIGDFFFIESSEGNTLSSYIGNESNLTLPEDYKGGNYSIRESAFYKCTELTSITIPNSVTTIGNAAFLGCSGLTSITIPNSVTTIGRCAFEDCTGLTSVNIPNSVTTIGNKAFYGCNKLTSVHITDIAAWCNISFDGAYSNPLYEAQHLYLNGKEIKDLVIPNDVTTIRDYAFYNCTGLTSITIPNSVTTIGVNAFYDCI